MRTTAEETRRNDRRILEAAVQVFSEKGYEAATMQEIADAARISRGPLYYRYKTKMDVYLAALEAHAAREIEEHVQLLRQDKPFGSRLREYLNHATRHLRSGRAEFPMDISADPRMEDANRLIRRVYADGYVLLTEEVARAVTDGELEADTDVEHLVNLIFIAFDGLRYSRLKSGILTSPEKVEAAVDHMCMLVQARYGRK